MEHRLTRPCHPWTNRQAERTVSTIKDVIVHAFHDATSWELRRQIADWQAACNIARQLKALRRRTPIEAIHAVWQQKPELFHQPPCLYAVGLNT
ncbi:integrase core domain-containing protein [Geminicoccus sp.]|uniref:integrase core domain-containing protein n=1 Tax=Geminicoccus sp. TaxID=2024832 RepID=UPI0039C8A4B0